MINYPKEEKNSEPEFSESVSPDSESPKQEGRINSIMGNLTVRKESQKK